MSAASFCRKGVCLGGRGFLLFFFFVFMMPLSARPAAAQSTGGRIRGTVTDASGGAVTGAKVTLINAATNISRDASSGANGEYLFLEAPVGTYEMDVTQQGFKKFIQKGITLNLNEVVTVDVTLQIGGASETALKNE